MFRTRYASQIICAYRPIYDAEDEVSSATTTKGMIEVLLPELSKGANGKPVEAMQILLIGNGFSCGEYGADGDFGTMTDAAVRRYQEYKKLDVDGVCGKDTWSKLLGK